MALKKTHLTVIKRERIAARLADRAFDDKIKAAQQSESQMAFAALRRQLTPVEWKLTASLPAYWLPRISQVRMEDPLSSPDIVSFPDGEPSLAVPATLVNKTITREMAGPHWEPYLEHRNEAKRLKTEKTAARRAAEAALAAFRTVEAACEGWPEAAAIIQEVCGGPASTNLPALGALNTLLDLPPEPDEKPYRECDPSDIALSA